MHGCWQQVRLWLLGVPGIQDGGVHKADCTESRCLHRGLQVAAGRGLHLVHTLAAHGQTQQPKHTSSRCLSFASVTSLSQKGSYGCWASLSRRRTALKSQVLPDRSGPAGGSHIIYAACHPSAEGVQCSRWNVMHCSALSL